MGLLVTQHITELMQRMHSLQKSGDLCDLTLTSSEGTEVKVHRIVLESCCAKDLTQRLSRDNLIFNVSDISTEILESVVHFMYTGEILLESGFVLDTVSAYQKFGLKSALEKLLSSKSDVAAPDLAALNNVEEVAQTHVPASYGDTGVEAKRKGKIGSSKRKPAAVHKKSSETRESPEPGAVKTKTGVPVKGKGIAQRRKETVPSESLDEKTELGVGLRRSSRRCSSRYRRSDGMDEVKELASNVEAQGDQVKSTSDQENLKSDIDAAALLQYMSTIDPNTFGKIDASEDVRDNTGHKETEENKAIERNEEKRPEPYKKRILKKHNKSQSDDKSFRCRRCDETFDTNLDLRAHRKQNSSCRRKLLTCDVCKVHCLGEKNKLIHMWKKHGKPLEENSKYQVICCKEPDCGFRTLHSFVMRQHTVVHTVNRPYCCEICGKTYKNKNILKVHKQNQHENSTSACVCPHCGKQLQSASSLHIHIQRIHDKHKRSCQQCDFTAYNKATIEEHMYRSHGVQYPDKVKVYKCEYCEYFTRWKNVYAIHIRRHKGELPFECDFCKKKFPARSDLTAHKKWHNDKRHKCPHVPCTFASPLPSKLRDHLRRMHSQRGEKPFACHECPYKTNIRGNLVIHLRKVHKLKVLTAENRVKVIAEESVNNKQGEARIPYLPGLSLPKPESAPAPSGDRLRDKGPQPIVVSVPLPEELSQLSSQEEDMVTVQEEVDVKHHREPETSAIQQAMVQSGVLPSADPNSRSDTVSQVVASLVQQSQTVKQPVHQNVAQENEPKEPEGQAYSTESIQSLMQEILKHGQASASVQSPQSQAHQIQTSQSVQPTMVPVPQINAALPETSVLAPSTSVSATPKYSQVIPKSVLAVSQTDQTVAQSAERVQQQTRQAIPQSVMTMLQTSLVPSSQSPLIPQTNQATQSQIRVPVPQLDVSPKATPQQQPVVTIDTATLQLLQNSPGSSLVIPQRGSQVAVPQSPQPVTPVISNPEPFTQPFPTKQITSAAVPNNQGGVAPIQVHTQGQIPVIVEKALGSSSETAEHIAQFPSSALSQQKRSVQGLSQPGTMTVRPQSQQVFQSTSKRGSHLKPLPKAITSILRSHSGISVSKSPTLSSHGSMVSLLTGKQQKDELTQLSWKTTFSGKSMVQTLAQGPGRLNAMPQQTSHFGQQQTPPKAQQTIPLLQQPLGLLQQRQIPRMLHPTSGMQQATSPMRQMAPTAQHTVVQSYPYPVHVSSSAIPTSVLALSESDDSVSTQTPTSN